MKYRLEAAPAVELDVEAAFDWYEHEQSGIGSNSSRNFAPRICELMIIHMDTETFVRAYVER